jgi:hypothetical protein
MKEIITAMATFPPKPGRIPIQKPIPAPKSNRRNAFHCKTSKRPSKNAPDIALTLSQKNRNYF